MRMSISGLRFVLGLCAWSLSAAASPTLISPPDAYSAIVWTAVANDGRASTSASFKRVLLGARTRRIGQKLVRRHVEPPPGGTVG